MNKIFDLALDIFGETDIYQLCGFILPDGTMLNFSHDGRQRDLDHREVGQVFCDLGIEYESGTDAMDMFEREGAIRFSMYGNHATLSLNTYQDPTWRQLDILKGLELYASSVWLDVYWDNGNRGFSGEFDADDPYLIERIEKKLRVEKRKEREWQEKRQSTMSRTYCCN